MIKITGMSLKNGGDDNNGVRQLATFDYTDALYEVRGAALIRFASNGRVTISMPRLHRYTDRETINSIRLKELGDKLALEDAAIRAYVALGGDTEALDESRLYGVDGWPLIPRPTDAATSNAEAVKWIEPVDPWAGEDKISPAIMPPAIRDTDCTDG